jgi:hypothetical protein
MLKIYPNNPHYQGRHLQVPTGQLPGKYTRSEVTGETSLP